MFLCLWQKAIVWPLSQPKVFPTMFPDALHSPMHLNWDGEAQLWYSRRIPASLDTLGLLQSSVSATCIDTYCCSTKRLQLSTSEKHWKQKGIGVTASLGFFSMCFPFFVPLLPIVANWAHDICYHKGSALRSVGANE